MSDSLPQTPNLTPQFCFNERAVRDFLRLSRSSLDDPISTHLNSLSTPSTTRPFSPLSINPKRPSLPPSSPSSLPPATCQTFLHTTLFPHWSHRDNLLTYCTLVANSPDPNDPDLDIRSSEAEKQSLNIVDERLDPYSGRWRPREARTEKLADVLKNERAVERIVRERVWRVVEERCGGNPAAAGGGGGGWEREYENWRRKEGER